ncbi:YbjN domain-containing protein [Lysobacter sp. BMK333-48F3]|uniref:YbjN domain-containing protein n=1 Tax=Lysobacter sp. BMK333-48F3 TaxID=2867962 RepID=UPI0021052716|nr:YbjN domain-containing protein [Lysobacter sp. BMK333-48F3]
MPRTGRLFCALTLSLLPALALAAPAAEPAQTAQPAAQADARIREQLDQLGYKYQVDEDGDYVLTFGLDGDRSQMAYVLSRTERYGKLQVREVWSPAYRTSAKQFPADVANRLLEDSQLSKMGGWVKQDSVAVFVVKLDAAASREDLDDAIDYVVRAADEMEAELSPGQDEF